MIRESKHNTEKCVWTSNVSSESAYTGINGLPFITHHNVAKIHESYKKPLINIEPLKSMNKLNQINGYVQIILDKLKQFWVNFERWIFCSQEWKFLKVIEALWEWSIRNSLTNQELRRDQLIRKERLLQTNQNQQKCVYSDGDSHSSSNCNKFTTVNRRTKILKKSHATTAQKRITLPLNEEVKDLSIIEINITTYQSAKENREPVSLNFTRRKQHHQPCFWCVGKWYQAQSTLRFWC